MPTPLGAAWRAAVRWSASALVAVPWLSAALVVSSVARDKRRAFHWLRRWCRCQMAIMGIEHEIVVTPAAREVLERHERTEHSPSSPSSSSPSRGLVFVLLNQESLAENWLVPLLLPRERPAFFFSNLGFLMLPWFGWLVWSLGAVAMLRGNAEQARRALDSAKERVRAGQSCYISIEGRRSVDGTRSEYKRGSVVLAIDTQATIVPVLFHGARQSTSGSPSLTLTLLTYLLLLFESISHAIWQLGCPSWSLGGASPRPHRHARNDARVALRAHRAVAAGVPGTRTTGHNDHRTQQQQQEQWSNHMTYE